MGRQRVDVKQIQPLYGQKQEIILARPLSYVDRTRTTPGGATPLYVPGCLATGETLVKAIWHYLPLVS